jgi:hypothetical protein
MTDLREKHESEEMTKEPVQSLIGGRRPELTAGYRWEAEAVGCALEQRTGSFGKQW